MDELLELEHQVDNAVGWLQDAILKAGECCSEPDGTPNGWAAMEEVAKRLDCSLRLLERALEPVREDVRKAREWQDEMADRADSQSY